ncbi:MAG: hypothetical protein A2W99_16580 [Bacteroidetes bacterium GWF2_33_16]|nr:MAG: hypothetical protein A2X00_14215 [Bacteroidetes bacterium GWE2_32_14]OFY03366.1 MAG: hypothetical protein A2W99_16580 [Bacteroidetes bacterium GWF2_33_16]
MKALISLLIFILFFYINAQGQTSTKETSVELPKKVKVPLIRNCQINVDGLFPEEEWNHALNFKISESFEIFFLANSENLYIGIKYAGKIADYKQALDCVSELYISTNNEEFYNLHSSARLAEGINKFSGSLKQAKYSLEEVNGWEANSGSHVKNNDLNCKGVEYRISLDKITGQSVKLAVNILAVNFSFRESVVFPADYSFKDSDKWLELIIQNSY